MALSLPKLQYSIPIVVVASGLPTKTYQQWWQAVADNVQTSVNGLSDAVANISTLQTQMNDRITEITAIQADLVTQLAAITAAQAQADTARLNDKISASATVPTAILTASDAGTSATITISNHQRLYGDGTSIPVVTGAALTGLAYSTLYAVYYDDPTVSNTTPTFIATTMLKDAQYNVASGRHFCGQVTTPASGGGSTSGGGSPPGGGGPYP